MISEYLHTWHVFVWSFGAMLLVTFFMMRQAKNFITLDPIPRSFSIMELEIPATGQELVNIIKGIFKLPGNDGRAAVKAVKNQLYLDFLFMPLAYGSIALVCLRVANKVSQEWLKYIFIFLAVLQLVAWLCDIVENIYLLKKMGEGDAVSLPAKQVHKAYIIMVSSKWAIALTATTLAVSAIIFFWTTGNYSMSSLNACGIAAAEILAFLILLKVTKKRANA
ncbi:MAG: hypothetical protein KF862_03720 [Chitinophagaceae bacterium]|nr:hypothetical protein [Chitinophagaceae bacterium]